MRTTSPRSRRFRVPWIGVPVLLAVLAASACEDAPTSVTDRFAPSRVDDLALLDAGPGQWVLTWSAPGDEGLVGRAEAYEVRRSSVPRLLTEWDEAEPVPSPPAPESSGHVQSMRLGNLPSDAPTYVALRARDEVGHWGPWSNVVTTGLSTTAPALTAIWGANVSRPILDRPTRILVDAEERVYVLDEYAAGHVDVFSGVGDSLATWPSPGIVDFTLLPDGRLLELLENWHYRIRTPLGELLADSAFEFIAGPEWRTSARCLTSLPGGDVLVADASQIVRMTPEGKSVGYFNTYAEDDLYVSSEYRVRDLSVDPAGNIYVISEEGDIFVFDAGGTRLDRWNREIGGRRRFEEPTELAWSPPGSLYLVDLDSYAVVRMPWTWGVVSSWGEYGGAPGTFRRPVSVAVGPDNAVFVCDEANRTIQRFEFR